MNWIWMCPFFHFNHFFVFQTKLWCWYRAYCARNKHKVHKFPGLEEPILPLHRNHPCGSTGVKLPESHWRLLEQHRPYRYYWLVDEINLNLSFYVSSNIGHSKIRQSYKEARIRDSWIPQMRSVSKSIYIFIFLKAVIISLHEMNWGKMPQNENAWASPVPPVFRYCTAILLKSPFVMMDWDTLTNV